MGANAEDYSTSIDSVLIFTFNVLDSEQNGKKKKNYLSVSPTSTFSSLTTSYPSSSHPRLATTSEGAAKNVTVFGKLLFFSFPPLVIFL